MTPACAQACPTASIQFGTVADLRQRAEKRVQQLHAQGQREAYLYGTPGDGHTEEIGGLNAFFLLIDKPEVYGLPEQPKLPSRNLIPSSVFSAVGAAAVGLLGLLSFRQRRMGHANGRGNDAAGTPREGGGHAV